MMIADIVSSAHRTIRQAGHSFACVRRQVDAQNSAEDTCDRPHTGYYAWIAVAMDSWHSLRMIAADGAIYDAAIWRDGDDEEISDIPTTELFPREY